MLMVHWKAQRKLLKAILFLKISGHGSSIFSGLYGKESAIICYRVKVYIRAETFAYYTQELPCLRAVIIIFLYFVVVDELILVVFDAGDM